MIYDYILHVMDANHPEERTCVPLPSATLKSDCAGTMGPNVQTGRVPSPSDGHPKRSRVMKFQENDGERF